MFASKMIVFKEIMQHDELFFVHFKLDEEEGLVPGDILSAELHWQLLDAD